MQTMLFDANAATQPHQDWWYLDSVPRGHLIASWIALEDIDVRAGRFYVLAGSQQQILHEPGMPHTEWLRLVKRHCDENCERIYAPALRKGDVSSGTRAQFMAPCRLKMTPSRESRSLPTSCQQRPTTTVKAGEETPAAVYLGLDNETTVLSVQSSLQRSRRRDG